MRNKNPLGAAIREVALRFTLCFRSVRMAFSLVTFLLVVAPMGSQTVFWDNPQVLSRDDSGFPQVSARGDWTLALWQDRRPSESGWSQVYLSLSLGQEGRPGAVRRNVLGPYLITGEDVPLFSAVLGGNLASPQILVAVLSESQGIDLQLSGDQGESFRLVQRIETPGVLLAPRLFVDSRGGYRLFLTQGLEDSFRILMVRSVDGVQWSEPQLVVDDDLNKLNFLPHWVEYQGQELLFYQALMTGLRPTYQLYRKLSQDQGQTWSDALWVTDFEEQGRDGFLPEVYDNQRPMVQSRDDGNYFLTWERRSRSTNPRIYFAELDRNGSILDWEAVSSENLTASTPRLMVQNGQPLLFWFDNRRGSTDIYMGRREGFFWRDERISNQAGDSRGAVAALGPRGPVVLWENILTQRRTLMARYPDTTTAQPRIEALNFQAGQRFSQSEARFRVAFPNDPSGIAGYNVLLSRSPGQRPAETLRYSLRNPLQTLALDQDAWWYISVISQDNAGNWSPATELRVFRDTVAPWPVRFEPLVRDQEGFPLDNSPELAWSPLSSDAISYSYRLNYLGPLNNEPDWQTLNLAPPQDSPLGRENRLSLDNRENGYYALGVRAFDQAGNGSTPSYYFFRMNKYRPSTRIFQVLSRQDELGRITLEILGRGFLSQGRINRVILDRDGREPFDLVLAPEGDRFRILSDTRIGGISLVDLPQGRYRVAVDHSRRGLLFTAPVLDVDESGVVKIGDFRNYNRFPWIVEDLQRVFLHPQAWLYWAVLSLLLAVFLMSLQRLQKIVRENRWAAQRAGQFLITEGDMTMAKDKSRASVSGPGRVLKKTGLGLRTKFTVSILALVLSVIGMLAWTLGFFITENSQRTLGEGLRSRAEVLLDSLVTGARTYLPNRDINLLDLSLLPDQIRAMDEALSATITGPGAQSQPGFSFVWATNNPQASDYLSTERLVPGISQWQDPIEEELDTLIEQWNNQAREQVSELAERLDQLSRSAEPFILRTDDEARSILANIQEEIVQTERILNERLREIGLFTGSYPEFIPEDLDTSQLTYTFYKPVLYRNRGEQVFYRGMVRLDVSIESIIAEISAARDQLIQLTVIIALLALGLGVLGALVLATITVNPIKKLVKGVALIRDTEDKEDLKGHRIQVKTGDELALLAETINDMTQGLVKAAAASKELTVGKEVQKMFIPLQTDRAGRKMTTGHEDLSHVEFFGYYEGAKGVSGDYFDYQKLDDRYTAIIKCDVAGKGVPAALIMVEVATIFLNHFKDWHPKGQGLNLVPLVYRINDLLEERGFKGRFAALTVGLMDAQTGAILLCNAGDNLIYQYHHREKAVRQHVMPKAPAAGVFPSMMVEMQSGFQQVSLTLEPEDTLFFFTDGMEEAQRLFRNSRFEPIAVKEPGNLATQTAQDDAEGIGTEELSIERILGILNAYYNKGSFKLDKLHNPLANEELVFDFSSSAGGLKDAILSVIAMEKLFRIYADPSASKDDKIKIDKVVVDLLRRYFRRFPEYFHGESQQAEQEEYVIYPFLKEDGQYDDLTILGIRKKL